MAFAASSLTDWIHVCFGIVAGVYALYLFRSSIAERRHRFVSEVLDKFYSDTDIRTVLYCVDSGQRLGEIRHGGSLEQQADKTLRYLDHMGYMVRKGHLKIQDLEPFRFEIRRLLDNDTVKEYLEGLRAIGVVLNDLAILDRGIPDPALQQAGLKRAFEGRLV